MNCVHKTIFTHNSRLTKLKINGLKFGWQSQAKLSFGEFKLGWLKISQARAWLVKYLRNLSLVSTSKEKGEDYEQNIKGILILFINFIN